MELRSGHKKRKALAVPPPDLPLTKHVRRHYKKWRAYAKQLVEALDEVEMDNSKRQQDKEDKQYCNEERGDRIKRAKENRNWVFVKDGDDADTEPRCDVDSCYYGEYPENIGRYYHGYYRLPGVPGVNICDHCMDNSEHREKEFLQLVAPKESPADRTKRAEDSNPYATESPADRLWRAGDKNSWVFVPSGTHVLPLCVAEDCTQARETGLRHGCLLGYYTLPGVPHIVICDICVGTGTLTRPSLASLFSA